MVEMLIFAWILVILGVGGFVADYIFPHIGPLQRYIDSLPIMQDEEDANEE